MATGTTSAYHTVYKHGWSQVKAGEQTEANTACGITFLAMQTEGSQ